MNISIFGLGYVGVVSAGCLASDGHQVIGVDVQQVKVDLINRGQTPIVEARVGELVGEAVTSGRLRATTSAYEAVMESELALVCVGTPSRPDGSLDQRYIDQVTTEVGAALRGRSRPFLVVMRSTMVPGTVRGRVIPQLEDACGRTLGDGYEVLIHPEFLREGSAVEDFHNPPKIVVGEARPGTAGTLLELYPERFHAPRILCSLEVAEMVKYCDNMYHALKITFANEIGQFCLAQGVDSREVMRIFCQDTKLNISPRYLRPGFAFGGSCLPKDLRAFLSVARRHNLDLPMLQGVLPSNRCQIERALGMILAGAHRRVGFHGIAFKPGTDDLRESPAVELAERLLGKGRRLVVYDESVNVTRLLGGNRSYVEDRLPHLAELLTHEVSELSTCDLIVLAHPAPSEQLTKWSAAGICVLDLTGQHGGQHLPGLVSIV